MLERTRRKCLDIRNRLYPEKEWPRAIHEQTIIAAAGSTAGSRPDSTYLEIGCGREASSLRRLCPHFRMAVGVDVEMAISAPAGARWAVVQADAHHLPFRSASLDIVGMADVLEHIADPVAMFRECARVLKSGGCLIVSTVNQWFPPIVLGRLLPHRLRQLVNGIATGTKEEDTFPVYYRANSPRALIGAAAKAGFHLSEFRHLSHHPRYLMFSVTLYRLGIVLERLTRRSHRLRHLRHFLHGVFVRENEGLEEREHNRLERLERNKMDAPHTVSCPSPTHRVINNRTRCRMA